MRQRGLSRSRSAKMRRAITEAVKGILLLTGIIAVLLIMVWLNGITTYAATSSTQSEAVQAEELNPYRVVILAMTEEEMTEMYQVLAKEAGIDTFEGRVATLQVMLNRVLTEGWPDTIHEVLSQKNPTQYSTYKSRHTAVVTQKEIEAVNYVMSCEVRDLPIGYDRVYQDCRPIGYKPIKVGKQYFGLAYPERR